MQMNIPVVLRVSRAGNGFSQMPGDKVYVTPGEALAMNQAGQIEAFNPDQIADLERMVRADKVPPPSTPTAAVEGKPNGGDGGSNDGNGDPPSGGESESNDPQPLNGDGDDGKTGESGDESDGQPSDETGGKPSDETGGKPGTPLSVLQLNEKAEQLLQGNGITTVESLDSYTVDMELENLNGIGSGWADQIRKARAAYQPE